MKKFLTIAMSFMLIICLSVLATGCTTKVKGKTFKCETATVSISDEAWTVIKTHTQISGMADKDVAAKLFAKEAQEDFYSVVFNKDGTYVFIEKDKTAADASADDKGWWSQDGKNITLYANEEKTVKSDLSSGGTTITIDKKVITANGHMFATDADVTEKFPGATATQIAAFKTITITLTFILV